MKTLFPDTPSIVEVGPRDGLQNEKKILHPSVRADLVTRLAVAGLHRIEAVSFVSPKAVPAMSGASQVLAEIGEHAGVCQVSGLVLNSRGAEDAVSAGCHEVNLVLVCSDTFSLRNQGKTTAQVLEQTEDVLPTLKRAGVKVTITLAAAFGCPFEGEIPTDRVLRLASRLAQTDCDEIALADTIGVATPRTVKDLFRSLSHVCPGVTARAHFHDTRSVGLANVMAAMEAGVSVFDASTGGYGGCPFAPAATGNIATEDLVYLFEREGIPTGIDLEALIGTARWLSDQLETNIPGGVANAGGFPDSNSLPTGAHS